MQAHAARVNHHLARAIAAYRPELLRGARQLVGGSDADDLIQSTLERALSRLDTFQAETNLLAWLRRIMSNLTVDTWRRQTRHPVCSLDDTRELPAPAPETSQPWEALSAADVRAAAAVLPEKFRQVFELFADHNLPYAEIARQLQIPIATVGTRLLRARVQLRKQLNATLATRAATKAGRNQPVQMVLAAHQLQPVPTANDQTGATGQPGRRAPARPSAPRRGPLPRNQSIG